MTVDELRSALEKANKVKPHLNESDLLKIIFLLNLAGPALLLCKFSQVTTLGICEETSELEKCAKIIDDFYNKFVCN